MFTYHAGALPGSAANAATSSRGRAITRSTPTSTTGALYPPARARRSGPEGGDRVGVADELVDAAHAAGFDREQQDLRIGERAAVRPRAADPREHGDAALPVGHHGLGNGAQRARGQPARFGDEPDDPLAALVDAAEAVVVAVVPGRVAVEHLGEPGEV